MRYASKTTVSSEKSRAEIETLLRKYGCNEFGFMTDHRRAKIIFGFRGHRIQFIIELPDPDAKKYHKDGRGVVRKPHSRFKVWDQDCRQSWRSFKLLIHAKLEGIESKITTFEEEFLPHIVLIDGETIGQKILPNVIDGSIYKSGKLPLLLPAPKQD
jgi:hypothetical protein